MELKNKISIIIWTTVALFWLYIVIRRLWDWYKNDFGYNYYLIVNTYVDEVNNTNEIRSFTAKVKAKNEFEAKGIFMELENNMEYTEKGNLTCRIWNDIKYYSKP